MRVKVKNHTSECSCRRAGQFKLVGGCLAWRSSAAQDGLPAGRHLVSAPCSPVTSPFLMAIQTNIDNNVVLPARPSPKVGGIGDRAGVIGGMARLLRLWICFRWGQRCPASQFACWASSPPRASRCRSNPPPPWPAFARAFVQHDMRAALQQALACGFVHRLACRHVRQSEQQWPASFPRPADPAPGLR